jgi:hypothetical protein
MKLLNNKNVKQEVINISSNNSNSILELANRVKEVTKSSSNIEFFELTKV